MPSQWPFSCSMPAACTVPQRQGRSGRKASLHARARQRHQVTDPGPGLIEIKRKFQDLFERARSKLMRNQVVRDESQLAASGREREMKIRGTERLLFVCHGNTNRSMLAEADCRTRIKLADGGSISSAGFHPRAGRPGAPVTVRLASEVGLDLRQSRSILERSTWILTSAGLAAVGGAAKWRIAVPRQTLSSAPAAASSNRLFAGTINGTSP